MPQKTITIKKIIKKEGIGKNGRKYRRVSLLGSDANFYSTFHANKVIETIQEGDKAQIEYKETDRQGSYDLVEVLYIDASPRKQTNPMTNQGEPRKVAHSSHSISSAMNPGNDPCLTPSLQAEWVSNAKEAIVLVEANIKSTIIISDEVLVELIRQYHAEWMAKYIQSKKEQNIERITKERMR